MLVQMLGVIAEPAPRPISWCHTPSRRRRCRSSSTTTPIIASAAAPSSPGSTTKATAPRPASPGGRPPSARSYATASTSAKSSSATPGTPAATSPWSTRPPSTPSKRYGRARRRHSKRSSSAFDYLLVSRIRCIHCGKAFVGAAAHGKRYRYPYYVCFSRQRYGTDTCPAERLRADLLEQVVIDVLMDAFQQADLFKQAIAASHTQTEPSATSTKPSSSPSPAASASPRPRLNGTWTPSRPAPFLRTSAASESRTSAAGSPNYDSVRTNSASPWTRRPASSYPSRQALDDLAEQVRIAMQTGPFQPESASSTPSSMNSGWRAAR